MVKLVVKQPIDPNALPGLTMLFNPSTAYFYDRESDGFKVTANETILEVGGHGFKHLFSRPTADGTVTSLKYYADDVLVYKLSGADVDLRDIIEEDIATATLMFFEGNDKFKGSADADIFKGRDGNDNLAGRGGNDGLYGQNGKDILDGGEGSDYLYGGPGKDTYLFSTAPVVDIADTIVKFQAGETIQLAASAFAGLVAGILPDNQFVVGTAAADGNDRVIYDAASGALYFDPDGTGATAALRFAQMQPNLDHFSADSIIVI